MNGPLDPQLMQVVAAVLFLMIPYLLRGLAR